MLSVFKKGAPPADLKPEHELPAAPEEKLITAGTQSEPAKDPSKNGLIASAVIVLLVLLLALLAIAIR